MNQNLKDRVNGFGSLFRLITPTLIFFIGSLMIAGQNDLKLEIKELKTHFVSHLQHHRALEVAYENRLTCIEKEAFTKVEAMNLEKYLREYIERRIK